MSWRGSRPESANTALSQVCDLANEIDTADGGAAGGQLDTEIYDQPLLAKVKELGRPLRLSRWRLSNMDDRGISLFEK
jgi:hypothetical protein